MGEFALSADDDLHRLLINFQADAEAMLGDGDLFRDIRERYISYLIEVAPAAFVSTRSGAHDPSDFVFPVSELLRDARLEGWAGNLAVRARNIQRRSARMHARADSIIELLRAEAS
jgi:hypothetical protein